MPLARIDLIEGQSANYRETVGEMVYDAMIEILKTPGRPCWTPVQYARFD